MVDPGKIFALLGILFLMISLLWNVIAPNLPKIPGDIYINRGGIKIYIPWLSSLILSAILTLLFNFFRK
ncbi:MAG: DUF2905 domain-containing protein [Candidatus Daviesbacteria bacterium]|nr:MAG: DUF2905 domain-containing protein [Candidatus Daviesbacteria bacterium]